MLAFGLAIFNTLYATQALLPTLTTELDITPSTAALTVSAATGALALCVVPASILSEKYGRGRVLVISALAATGIGLLLPIAQNAEQLIAMRALQGAMIAGTPAVAMTWLSEELDHRDLPGAMGLYIAGNSIGGLTGRLIPAGLLEVTSWRWALLGSGLVAFLLAVVAVWLLPEQRNFVPKLSIRPSAEIRAMARHLRNPRLLVLYTTAFVAMGVFVSMYNFFGFRAVLDFGLPRRTVRPGVRGVPVRHLVERACRSAAEAPRARGGGAGIVDTHAPRCACRSQRIAVGHAAWPVGVHRQLLRAALHGVRLGWAHR